MVQTHKNLQMYTSILDSQCKSMLSYYCRAMFKYMFVLAHITSIFKMFGMGESLPNLLELKQPDPLQSF